jgi:hypothetical protein
VVIQMDEALCYSASTWWCAAGRSSRVLETPTTTAMAPRRGAVSHTRDLPTRPAGLTAWFTRFRFIDRQGTASELFALEPGNGGFRRGVVGHFDEAKAFGSAGIAVHNDPDLVHSAIRLKELAKVIIGGGERQITNINIHGRVLVGNGANDRQVIRTVCRSKQCKSHM